MRTFYPAADFPILYKSTYDWGDLVDPVDELPEDERCVKGYMAQSDLIGAQLLNIVSSFVNSRASLIVEGIHLSVDLMMKIVTQSLNVIPFLIYIKKEAFRQQRFAVRAKYMTTDPTVNRYISHFSAIRTVQSCLSKEGSCCLAPKLDNRNID
jgi:2-phosphoglycerate kinase